MIRYTFSNRLEIADIVEAKYFVRNIKLNKKCENTPFYDSISFKNHNDICVRLL